MTLKQKREIVSMFTKGTDLTVLVRQVAYMGCTDEASYLMRIATGAASDETGDILRDHLNGKFKLKRVK